MTKPMADTEGLPTSDLRLESVHLPPVVAERRLKSACSLPELDWQPASGLILPERWQGWLLDPGSLTLKLKQAFPGEFKVKVILHHWSMPQAAERQILALETGELASVREVFLIADGKPRVFARSVFPASTLLRNHYLMTLKDRSLGEVLFADPTLKRGKIEVTSLPADRLNSCLPLPYGTQLAWGRRSVFYLSGAPLLVSEFFLP